MNIFEKIEEDNKKINEIKISLSDLLKKEYRTKIDNQTEVLIKDDGSIVIKKNAYSKKEIIIRKQSLEKLMDFLKFAFSDLNENNNKHNKAKKPARKKKFSLIHLDEQELDKQEEIVGSEDDIPF